MAPSTCLTAPDAAAAATLAADHVEAYARERLAVAGTFRLAVSGGQTPALMFAALAERDLPWPRVHVFQVDERIAPAGHPDRNAVALQSSLLSRVGAVGHLMDVEADDPARAAAAYATELREPIDLVHLGVGDDGHTASWPPGDPVIDERDRDVAIVGPFNGRLRMTLTPPVIDRARVVLFLVTGAGKAGVVTRLRAGDPALVASRVRTPALLIADAAALTSTNS